MVILDQFVIPLIPSATFIFLAAFRSIPVYWAILHLILSLS